MLKSPDISGEMENTIAKESKALTLLIINSLGLSSHSPSLSLSFHICLSEKNK